VPLALRRVILFSDDVVALAGFYRDVIGLPLKGAPEKGWVELDAGGAAIAIHAGRKSAGATKIVFGSSDVARTREELIARGAKLGPVKELGGLALCDGKDPDGNPFQISNRS
jgi:hypothetical protein